MKLGNEVEEHYHLKAMMEMKSAMCGIVEGVDTYLRIQTRVILLTVEIRCRLNNQLNEYRK